MTTNRKIRRYQGPPTKEELIALQQARVERIAKNTKVPWTRYFMAAVMGLLTIIIVGGGVMSLILATGVIAIVSRGRISFRKSPLDK